MEFKTTREALLKALELLRLSSGDPLSPESYQNTVKIEAHKEAIYMFSCCHSSAMLKKVKGDVKGIGACVVHLVNLLELVKKLVKDKPVKLVILEDGRLEVRQQRSRFKFSTMDLKGYPAFTYLKKEMYNPINPTDFRDAVAKTSYCIDKDGVRTSFKGLLIEPVEDKDAECKLVATDGIRLAIARVLAVFDQQVLIPINCVEVILKAFKDEKDVGVFADERFFFFQSEDIYYNSRLLSAEFPDYRKVFPEGKPTLIKVLRKDMLGALERLNLFSKDTGTLKIQSVGNKLELRCRDKSVESLEVVELLPDSQSEPFELGVSTPRILQMFQKFTDSEITMGIYGATLPIHFKEQNADKFLMPIRI